MPIPIPATEVLDREFLEIRARILEIGSALDRMSRASGDVSGDARLTTIRRGLAILQGESSDRAEQIQLLFSLPYDDGWKARFELPHFRPLPR